MTIEAAERLVATCRASGLRLALAESCTGGMVASAITDVAGASEVFDRGFVTYSNQAKIDLLGVPEETLARFGAVSAEAAAAMVSGLVALTPADLGVAVTGIAGPGGGSVEKPVGLVYFAAMRRGGTVMGLERRYGPLARDEVRRRSVADALRLLLNAATAGQAPG